MTIMGWWGDPVLHQSNGFISCRYAKGALKLLAQAMSVITEEAPAHFLWRHQLLFGMAKNIDYRPLPSERIFGWNMKVR